MHYKHLLTLLIFSIVFSLSTSAQISTPLFIVKPYLGFGLPADSIWMIPDTSDYSQINQGVKLTIASSTDSVNGCTGMAVRPCTGEIFIVYKKNISSGLNRYLGIVDPTTGIIAEVGNLGDRVSGITFGSENQLYAVTGDGAAVAETLYKVDISTAMMTLFTPLGNGDDGEQIEFCPDDGNIYHWSGYDDTEGTRVMEKVDTASGAIVNIPLSGFEYTEILGAEYMGNGQFLMMNTDHSFMIMDTSGFSQIPIDTINDHVRGLVFPDAWITTSSPSTICANETATFTSIAGDSYQWFNNGMPVAGETNPTLTTNVAGDYQCEITKGGGCGTMSNTLSLNVKNAPGVNINPGPNAYFCAEGDSVMLTGAFGGMSQWYFNGTMIVGADSNTVYASMPGNYNMTKTNSNGCKDSASVGTMVGLAPMNMISPSDTVERCFDDSVALLIATPGANTYEWYLDGALVDGATDDSLQASGLGLYTSVAVFGECRDSTVAGTEVVLDPACAVGIEDFLFANDLKVYPIPATRELNVSLTTDSKEQINLEIYSIEGKMIYHNRYENSSNEISLKIDTNDFAQGVYFLRISQGERSGSMKFVKK